ncbi:MAG: hypothetical protein EPN26_15795 [Rhodospirillales bacterium]|nr:MAG: hypothetical protein EPN26_15795 [Rhodospirillales bacterium]
MILRETHEKLRDLQLVDTQFEFSTDWLGKNKTYLSCVLARDLTPSAEALLTLMRRLNRKADEMQQRYRHSEAEALRALGKRVWEDLLTTYPC